MKRIVTLLFICLLGCAVADGITQSQKDFLKGTDPSGSPYESKFEQYLGTYWASYIENPDTVSYGALKAGPIEIDSRMYQWMLDFPFDVGASSFGQVGATNESTNESSNVAMQRYIFGDSIELYDVLHSNGFQINIGSTSNESVQKNRQFLEQQIINNLGL